MSDTREKLIELKRSAPTTKLVYADWKLDHPVQTVQTNADRIRAMSDEELAKLLSGMCQANAEGESHCNDCILRSWCPACGHEDEWLDWLKLPAKEDAHDAR